MGVDPGAFEMPLCTRRDHNPNQAAHAKRLLSHHLAERHSKALRSVDEPTEDVDDRTRR